MIIFVTINSCQSSWRNNKLVWSTKTSNTRLNYLLLFVQRVCLQFNLKVNNWRERRKLGQFLNNLREIELYVRHAVLTVLFSNRVKGIKQLIMAVKIPNTGGNLSLNLSKQCPQTKETSYQSEITINNHRKVF